MSAFGPKRRFAASSNTSVVGRIVLQNSKVAAPRIFRENKKRETITNSYTLSRGAEIAGEFNARGSVPSRLYTEDAPTARRIFDHLCKTTFATQSGVKQTSRYRSNDAFDPERTFARLSHLALALPDFLKRVAGFLLQSRRNACDHAKLRKVRTFAGGRWREG